MTPRDLSPASIAVSAGRPHAPGDPLSAPITLASALVPGGDAEYARAGNPVWAPLETIVGELEGGDALAFASGIAASAAVFSLVPAGGVVVAPTHGYYGTTHQLRQRGDVEVRLVDVSDTPSTVDAMRGATHVWLESPTNPAMEVADLPTLIAAAHDAGALVAVDNTFRTPLRERPLELGADIVTHSASKLLAGHSDVILGLTISRDPELYAALRAHRHDHGAIPGALEAWLTTRGLRTLAVRLDRAESNARELAERLTASPLVDEVRYPGFGTIIGLVLDDDQRAQRATESSRLVRYATSLGGVESTWERRRRHANEAPSIPAGLIRLSVGIEDVEDLWSDIEAALA
ncbi:PLP-dependent transferase [Aeromicrobium sp. YIM 150415]|uniref:trans-sulfuration enzyme family protein n=1 Tax=Aeromicrobium sp. YIM 150415 TaxID=2803912 RepID=UPI001964048C|nr:PLP-dependent transferase [Aeromicrobium sp. YIM 150415]MBM9461829.1 PLP-dependent transferase [Aeromicrobium sp. YIM 150415]MBM9463177.1 PLP-dependent transferase [Aeromicrobium sp. YIM 150415]